MALLASLASALGDDDLRLLQLAHEEMALKERNRRLEEMCQYMDAEVANSQQSLSELERLNGALRSILHAELARSRERPASAMPPVPAHQAHFDSDMSPGASSSCSPCGASRPPAPERMPWREDTTTVLIQKIPSRLTRAEFLAAFPPDGSYDFLYLPFTTKQRRTAGFCLINFVSPAEALAFRERAHDRPLPRCTRPCKPLDVFANRVQGFEENVLLAAEKMRSEPQNESYWPLAFCAGRAAQAAAARWPGCVNAQRGTLPVTFDFATLAAHFSEQA